MTVLTVMSFQYLINLPLMLQMVSHIWPFDLLYDVCLGHACGLLACSLKLCTPTVPLTLYCYCKLHTARYEQNNFNSTFHNQQSKLNIPHSGLHRQYDDSEFCWMEMGPSIFFLAIPALVAILINIFFLGSVVRILRYKDTSFS